MERNDSESMKQAFSNQIFDIVYDNLAYCSNAVKYALDTVRTDYYVMTSSASVYNPPNPGVMEEDFSAEEYPFVWCNRDSGAYAEGKRMAEAALAQNYAQAKQCAVRFPVVLGKDDYTERLRFYVSIRFAKFRCKLTIRQLRCALFLLRKRQSFSRDWRRRKFLALSMHVLWEKFHSKRLCVMWETKRAERPFFLKKGSRRLITERRNTDIHRRFFGFRMHCRRFERGSFPPPMGRAEETEGRQCGRQCGIG